MLVLFEAEERTAAQYRTLLGDVGLRVERTPPTSSSAGLSVIEATIA